ncbi:MAG: hypothetical protein UY50_C0040G0007 [Parcubacteria group bacterium GW2011_GWA2_49_9]|nr:MAG: hypothetical protein UY50_C0040G0007 [Parcubacteria group bacterium GW2011_GWA2_49_9]
MNEVNLEIESTLVVRSELENSHPAVVSLKVSLRLFALYATVVRRCLFDYSFKLRLGNVSQLYLFRKAHKYRRSHYQLDFLTPGIIPSLAYSRKQIRQSPKSRIKARLRPQRKQRRTMRELNLGFLSARALVEVFAMSIFNVAKRSIKIATPSLEIA